MSRKTALVVLGFTVLALVAAKLLLPSYVTTTQQGREFKLRQDVGMMNAVITQYTLDKQLPPHSLDDLVVAGYLREVPLDPMTGRKDTWVVRCSSNLPRRGIVGIESGHDNTSGKGSLRCD
jgi:general secretion pathway protein G